MKTICFDFDGVIHSYVSGWKGLEVIPDPPVSGIKELIQHLREQGYRVVVQSSRCNIEEGKVAVENYLSSNGIEVDGVFSDKPPAIVYIDDRAICFDGDVSNLYGAISSFKPWTER